jgi:unsaturated rhamnogalacturonyl hydrolase
MSFRKQIILASLSAFTASSLLWSGEKIATIQVSNPSGESRFEEAIIIGLSALGVPENEWQCGVFEARKKGLILPTQTIDSDGDSQRDSILILSSLNGNETIALELVQKHKGQEVSVSPKRTQVDLSTRVGGEWVEGKRIGALDRGNYEYIGGEWADVNQLKVPAEHFDHSNYIRYEGVGIESDLVGYRIYLDWRNGFDIFGKTTPRMVLKDVGLDGFESYHEMQDWGMDILKVGDAIGIGGYGLWDGEKVIRVSDIGWEKCTLLENGHFRSSLKIAYGDWEFCRKKIDLDAVLSMQAGSRLVDVQLTTSEAIEGICAGIVKEDGVEIIQGESDGLGEWSYLATWGKQSLDGKTLGMAILFRKDSLAQITDDALNQVVVLKSDNRKYHYRFLAAWEGEPDGIQTLDEFRAYLEEITTRINRPLKVVIQAGK